MRTTRRWAGVALAAVLLAATGATPGAASQPTPDGRLSLASQTPWVGAGGTFELRLDVDDVREPERVEVAVTVHDPVRSRSQFARTLGGASLASTVQATAAPLVSLGFDAGGAVRVVLPLQRPGEPRDPARLPPLRPGVHPVSVALRESGGGRVIDGFVTHLVRLPDGGDVTPLGVAWVQPVAAPPALRPDGSVVIDPEDLRDLATVAAAVAASPVPLTLVPRPESLDGLAVAGTEGAAILADLGRALDGRQVVTGPYVDVDAAALVAAGLEAELTAQRTRGAEAIGAVLGVRPDPRTWASTGAVDGPSLARLRGLGVDRVVLPEEALEPVDLPLTLARPFVVGDAEGRLLEAVSVDPGLAAHFDADDEVLAAHQLLADLAVLFYDSPGLRRGVVVRPPPDWRPSAALLGVVLPALEAAPIVQPLTVDGLFDSVDDGDEPLRRELRPDDPEPLGLPVDGVESLRRGHSGFASMTQSGSPEAAHVEHFLLVALAGGLDATRRAAYLDGGVAALGEELDGIGILDRSSYRLTAREGTIPLTIVKDVPYAVRVTLVLSSEKLEFVDGDPADAGRLVQEVVLDKQNTAIAVPVRARTSGAFPLLLTLESPDGAVEIGASRVTVRSTAASGVGVVLSLGAGLFLLVWWANHWRSARRDRRLVPA